MTTTLLLRRHAGLTWMGALLAALALSPSLAAEPEKTETEAAEGPKPLSESLAGMAKAEYAAARILYQDGDYSGALTKLENAHRLSGDPRLLWNMAACEKHLRHYAAVLTLLERYLAEGAAVVTEQDRAQAEALRKTVGAFVSRLTIEAQPIGSDVFLNGKRLGKSPVPSVAVDMGKHEVRVEKAGFVAQKAVFRVPGGKPHSVSVKLVAEVREGRLRVVADARATIVVDGKRVGRSVWDGRLPSGTHTVHITAPGKEPHHTEVVVKDDDVTALHVTLKNERVLPAPRNRSSAWWWVAGSAVLAGAGTGAYFLFRPQGGSPDPELGTWGAFEL